MPNQTWFDKHPEDAKKFLKDAEELRKSRLNEFGSDKKKNWRLLGSVPVDMYYNMIKLDPKVFETKAKARKFFNDIPALKIAKKI